MNDQIARVQRYRHQANISMDQEQAVYNAANDIKAKLGSIKEGRREIIRQIREIADKVDEHNRK